MIDLSRYQFAKVLEGEEFALFRGTSTDVDLPTILLVGAVSEHPVPGTLERLEHAYSLRDELDSDWAARPLALIHREGRPVLVFEDPGGEPLDLLLGQPMEIGRFLPLAIGIAIAVGKLHQRGLIHKDIKPARILVDAASGSAWLTGFEIASRLPRERQPAEPPEMIAGTLAYMAPEQTGRMNRSIDSRSDLYSLGVTFYRMLTGVLPFTASDPMEWVHCHIARQPIAPDQLTNEIPAPLSAIVMKLLAKTAEERYQTAAGVEADLRKCLLAWESFGKIEPFPVGAQDVSGRLLIPERLYGREREIDALLASFDRVVTNGTSELVLVSGYSGIGKSSVVHEVHKVLVPPRGLFASGKFDQYQRDIPYATLAQAFHSLVRPLLGRSDAELGRWRDALSKALGPHGQLVTSLVPELELVIGRQPPVPELPPHEAQNRFQTVFRRFLSVFARKEHPLTLFLDDLQWLDTATIELLEHLVTHSEVRYLLLIGAYRDNEVGATHPLRRMSEAIRNAGARVQEIVLEPLRIDDVSRLVAGALQCELEPARSLAELVQAKTGGNPFFAIQFFTALAEERMLSFNPVALAWEWDINRIRAKSYTDNVVDLVAGKLKRFAVITQEALKQFACLGNVADVATLIRVHGQTEEAVNTALWEAVLAGLVVREDNAYKFLHDRIQQAAYTLIPEEQRAEFHLRIGRVLLASMTEDQLSEHLFEVANQFSRGAVCLVDQDEKLRVAAINLRAGRKAKASTAYASACVYLAAGMALLQEGDWSSQYDLMFALRLERAECEFLTANFEPAEQLIAELIQRAKSKVDQAAVYHLNVLLHTVKSENAQAVDCALTCLRLLGIDIPARPTGEQVQTEYEAVWRNLDRRSIEDLIDLPLMADPELPAAMQVFSTLLGPAYFTDMQLFSVLVCRMANISIQHGTSGASAHGFAYLGGILGLVFNRFREGYRFAKLACDLVEKHGFIAYQAKAYHAMALVSLWTQPITTAIDFNRAAIRAATETGDLTSACYSITRSVTVLLLRNDPLDAVRRESEVALDFVLKAKFRDYTDAVVSQQRFIAAMQGRTASFSSFSDEHFDEAAFEVQLTTNRSALIVLFYWIIKLKARFLSGNYAEAAAAAGKAEPLLWAAAAHIQVLDYFYYSALAVAALYENAGVDDQNKWRELLQAHREQLRKWVDNYSPTFADKHALVSAELARVEGRDRDAMRLYEEAIRLARENGFVQNEGVANELAARFYLKCGIEKAAHSYLRDARYCFLRWGALGKAKQLDELYPAIEEQAFVRPRNTIGTSVDQLELETVVKASRAVSSEIVLEKLIKTLMTITVEHAGAQRGLLILPQGEELRIAAEAKTRRDAVAVHLQDVPVTPSELPDSLLQYVIRTQESVILDDASTQNLFSQDEYVRHRGPRSVLCLPLVKQVNLVGVLYLENNLAPRVFTAKRLAMLQILASEAAISLDHARLYADLNRVNMELRRSEAYLVEGEKISHTASWAWNFTTGVAYWSQEHFRIFGFDPEKALPSFQMFLQRIHSEDRGRAEQIIDRAVCESRDFEQEYRIVLPDGSIKYVHTVGHPVASESGVLEFIGTAMDVTTLKRTEEMRTAMARERELFAQQRAADLAKANVALRGCLDALASVPELDDFLGQVMAAITGQLGAFSSTLRVRNFEQNTLPLELIFQDGRVMTPDEANYPENWQSVSVEQFDPHFFYHSPLTRTKDEQRVTNGLNSTAAIVHTLDPHSPMPDDQRSYLRQLGVKTLLIVPLISRGQPNGRLTFRFTEERDFHPEELEIVRALATQASLAIHLTRLAKRARQSAILEERNQLAAEIHDSLAQSFTGISLQLGVAGEQLAANEGDPLHQIRRADEIAKFGLAEARRSILSLGSNVLEESGLTTTLQRLVEHSNVAGRLRCVFQFDVVPEEILPQGIQHELLRFAQEAISNAVRHAQPTLVNVTLRWRPPDLILKVNDNGSGISDSSLEKSEGFGLRNMRTRAAQINAKLDIQTAAGAGTSIILTVPIPG
jgi:PAS domain S-box-containing protein